MVQTAPTSHADQLHVPGATAVRVIGVLLILLGGFKLISASYGLMLLFHRGISTDYVLPSMIGLAVIGLLTVSAGALLARRHRAGRLFGLVVCSIALANQLFAFGSILIYLYIAGPLPSLGMVFWAMNVGWIVLLLVGIVVIARWHPPRLPGD
jgi:drug/metabolite transporter (DMT)-like permease